MGIIYFANKLHVAITFT